MHWLPLVPRRCVHPNHRSRYEDNYVTNMAPVHESSCVLKCKEMKRILIYWPISSTPAPSTDLFRMLGYVVQTVGWGPECPLFFKPALVKANECVQLNHRFRHEDNIACCGQIKRAKRNILEWPPEASSLIINLREDPFCSRKRDWIMLTSSSVQGLRGRLVALRPSPE